MNSVEMEEPPANAGASADFFLARQPILGRDQMLVAFELLFRRADSRDADVIDDLSATASVISNAAQLGLEQVIGDQIAFVNCDAVVLMSDFIRFLPSNKMVLEILETVKATPEVLARIVELKALGFRFALDDVIADSDDVRQFMPHVDIIKVDLKGVLPSQLQALTVLLRDPTKKLLAEKVETREEFEHCLALGFAYFQGYYFARPVVLTGRAIAPSQLVVIDLLELINSDAETAAIERSIKRDALLSMNLLRLVNTPVAGIGRRIDAMAPALMVLGRRQLQRWLQILLYATPGAKVEFRSPLLQMATTRGKLLELLVSKRQPGNRAAADVAFTVGILSLMDTLLSMLMSDVLASLMVTDEVRAALLDRTGPFGGMLALVEMLETASNNADVFGCLDQLGLTMRDLREVQLACFEWVNALAHSI